MIFKSTFGVYAALVFANHLHAYGKNVKTGEQLRVILVKTRTAVLLTRDALLYSNAPVPIKKQLLGEIDVILKKLEVASSAQQLHYWAYPNRKMTADSIDEMLADLDKLKAATTGY